MTNWEHYFGSPEAAAHMEVVWGSWPISITVYSSRPFSSLTCEHRLVASFHNEEEYRAWLVAEYDDGTVRFEE